MRIIRNFQSEEVLSTVYIFNPFPDKIDTSNYQEFRILNVDLNTQMSTVYNQYAYNLPLMKVDITAYGNLDDAAIYLFKKDDVDITIEHLVKFAGSEYELDKLNDKEAILNVDYAIVRDLDNKLILWIFPKLQNKLLDNSSVLLIVPEGYWNNTYSLIEFEPDFVEHRIDKLRFAYVRPYLELTEADISGMFVPDDIYNQLEIGIIDKNSFINFINSYTVPIVFSDRTIYITQNGKVINTYNPYWFSFLVRNYPFSLDVHDNNRSDFLIDMQYITETDKMNIILPNSVRVVIIDDVIENELISNNIAIPDRTIYFMDLIRRSKATIFESEFKYAIDKMGIKYVLLDEYINTLPKWEGEDLSSYKNKCTDDELELLNRILELGRKLYLEDATDEGYQRVFNQLTHYLDAAANRSFIGGAYGEIKLYEISISDGQVIYTPVDTNGVDIGFVNYTNPSSLIFYRKGSEDPDLNNEWFNSVTGRTIRWAYTQLTALDVYKREDDIIEQFKQFVDGIEYNGKYYVPIIWEMIDRTGAEMEYVHLNLHVVKIGLDKLRDFYF